MRSRPIATRPPSGSARRLLAAMGSTLEPDVRNESSNEIRDQYLDATKAKTMLGWTPDYSFEQLIDEMIEAFRVSVRAGAVQ
jgi:CDP-glucose 4,6-dehydratase